MPKRAVAAAITATLAALQVKPLTEDCVAIFDLIVYVFPQLVVAKGGCDADHVIHIGVEDEGIDALRARQDLAILEANLPWQDLRCVRSNQVHLLDGNAYFSRSGPRLVDSLEILARIVQGALQDTSQRRTAQSLH